MEEIRKQEKKEVKLNDKHVKLRLIIFITSALVAVGAISFGVYSYSKKSKGTDGWNTYSLNYDSTYTFYYQNMYLDYYFSADESSSKASKVKNYFTDRCKYVYSLIDSSKANAENYDVHGIAYINAHPNEAVEVNKDLYDILTDAYGKTLQKKHYSLFSGYLDDYWKYYQTSEKYTISENYISDICNLIDDVDNFSLNLYSEEGKYYCVYSYSDNVASFISESENEDVSALSLNTLFYSYYIDYVAKDMIEAGYYNGTVYSHTGEKIYMNQNFFSGNEIELYDSVDNKPYVYAKFNNKNYTLVSSIRNFPVYASYEAEFCFKFKEGTEIWDKKNLFYSSKNGYSNEEVRNSTLITSEENISLADLTYQNLNYVSSKEYSITSFSGNVSYFVLLEGEEEKVYTNDMGEYLELIDNGIDEKYTLASF